MKLGDNLEIKIDYHLHGQISSLSVINIKTGKKLYEQNLKYEDVEIADGLQPRFDGKVSQSNTQMNTSDAVVNTIHNFLYDMSGNLVRDEENGLEHLFDYDENGRMLSQTKNDNKLVYNYVDKSYKLNTVNGLESFDPSRVAPTNQNFVYDASGRMIEDKSKHLKIKYDSNGFPICFSINGGYSSSKKIIIYDPNGTKISELLYEDDKKKSRKTDLVIGGKKVIECHQNYENAKTPISEYVMIYGKSGVIGRVHPDKNKEWYVKDYQGSVVMTSFDERTGSALKYEPYGNQKHVVVDGDLPFEQYTGKNFDSFDGLYYFGSRYYDPMLGLWISPDPQNEFFNPYGRSNDPVNNVDGDGECEIFCVIVVVTSVIVGSYVGGTVANDGEVNPTKWDWSSGKTWGYMGIGAVIGGLSSYLGVGVVGGGLASTLGSGAIATGFSSAVGTSVATALTYAGNEIAFGGIAEGRGLFERHRFCC